MISSNFPLWTQYKAFGTIGTSKPRFFPSSAAFDVKDWHAAMTDRSMVSLSTRRRFLISLTVTLLLAVASGAGGAAESRQSAWDKTLKSAETEGEVAVYVVDYPRFTVSQFQKA